MKLKKHFKTVVNAQDKWTFGLFIPQCPGQINFTIIREPALRGDLYRIKGNFNIKGAYDQVIKHVFEDANNTIVERINSNEYVFKDSYTYCSDNWVKKHWNKHKEWPMIKFKESSLWSSRINAEDYIAQLKKADEAEGYKRKLLGTFAPRFSPIWICFLM